MDLLAKHNINEAVFTLHYLGDMIKTYRKRRSMGNFRKLFGARQKTRHRRERPCGFGRDFSWEYLRRRIFRRSNCSKRGGESVLVLSGDGITDIDLSAVIRAHEQSDAAATIVLKRVAEPTEYGVALLDENGTIKVFGETGAERSVQRLCEHRDIYPERRCTGTYPEGYGF